MTQLATPTRSTTSLPFGLASNEAPDAAASNLARWDKVLSVMQDLDAGLYDDAAYVESRLDACMDRLLDDLTQAD